MKDQILIHFYNLIGRYDIAEQIQARNKTARSSSVMDSVDRVIYAKGFWWKALLSAFAFIIVIGFFKDPPRKEAKSTNSIERFFSPMNGSNPEMVRAVKETMHDPSSFKHVETKYIDKGSEIRILMRFRGTNTFGGTVTNIAGANLTKSTRALKDLEIEPSSGN